MKRPLALVCATLVAAATLTPLVAPPAQAAPAFDTRPVDAGAAWLVGQLSGSHLMHNPNFGGFDDYGLSIDTEFALATVGGYDATVTQIADAVAANVDSYTTYPTSPSNGTHITAGAIAKAVVAAQEASEDPTSFGGENLVQELEARVATGGAIVGRIQDQWVPGDDFEADYANVIGQAYAAEGLTAAGSTDAAEVTSFLLEQQCSAGWFRLSFTTDTTASDQSCDGDATSTPDTDVTALAVLALLPQQGSNPAAATAITDATTWLLTQQKTNGSFGGSGPTSAANANSTGVAGWALGEVSQDAAATKAATWIRAHQAADEAPCTTGLTSSTGAIGYDGAALTAGRSDGITDATSDQWRRASTQALPVLQWAALATGSLGLDGPGGYVKAHSTHTFTVSGAAPGERVCVNRADIGGNAGMAGSARLRVTVGGGTATRTYTAYNSDKTASATTDVAILGWARFDVRLGKERVWRRHLQTVRVPGMAPHEAVTLFLHGRVLKHGKADAHGVYATSFRVGRRLGLAAVKVAGQFPSLRYGRALFTVR